MLINVYQKHIDRGFRVSELLCPIAIAMSEQLGKRVAVWGDRAYLYYTGEYYILPEQAIKSYMRFDRTGLMRAFSFELGRLKPAEKKKEKVEAKTA